MKRTTLAALLTVVASQAEELEFQSRYAHVAPHTHHFNVTSGFQWTLQASTNLRDWTDVDSPFTAQANKDGTTDYVYTRSDKVREFFRFALKQDLVDYITNSTVAAMQNSNAGTSDVMLYDFNGHRNPANFMNGLKGVTGLVAYNDRSQGGGDWLHGCAVTPEHIVCCKHAAYTVGDNVTFLTADNEAVTRTITHREVPPGGTYDYDFVICRLDSPLPESIEPLKIAGAEFFKHLDGELGRFVEGIKPLAVFVNQDERVFVNQVNYFIVPTYEDDDPDSYNALNKQAEVTLHGSPWQTFPTPDERVHDWEGPGRGGDSGSPLMFVVGDELVLTGVMTGYLKAVFFGQLSNSNDLDMMVKRVDEAAEVKSVFTIQQLDLSAFNQYSE